MALSIARSPALSAGSAVDLIERHRGIAARDSVKESQRSRDSRAAPTVTGTAATAETQDATRAMSLGRERASAARALISAPAESSRAVPRGILDGAATPSLAKGPANALASAYLADSEVGGATPVLAEEPTVEEAAGYLRDTPQAETLDDMTHDQLRAYNVILQEVGSDESTLEHHEGWHHDNGSGGQKGAGSGETFLGMHRSMLNEVEAMVDPTGNWSAPAWDPTQPIPPELTAPGVARPTDLAPIERPAWLTLDGEGSESGNERFGETIEIDGQSFDSLDDFENPDQLGRAIGESSYHASAHVDIGGPMGSLRSPSDPIFYGWHGHIDAVFDEWLETPNGKAWQAENPGDPLLDGATPMSTYDSGESLEAARNGDDAEHRDHHK